MGMEAKVLLVNGSPRRYGGCYKLLIACLHGVRDAGGYGEIIHLYDYNIKPCIGCVSDDQRVCRYPCIIDDDDFNKLGEKMLESHGLVFATPVYWYGVSGVLKNLLDRMTSMENMIVHEGRSLLDGKIAGFIAVGNDTGSLMAIAYMMSVLNSMGFHIPPWALAYHNSLDDVVSNRDAILDAYNIGFNVVVSIDKLSSIGKWYRVEVDVDRIVRDIIEKSSIEYKRQYRCRAKMLYKEGV